MKYLVAGKDAGSVANLQADFAARLAQMFADAPGGVTINSGYRSPERQAQLWQEALAKYGDPEVADDWVARPGKSNHNHGGAVDLGYADDATKAWVHANAQKYGLNFPMAHEPWHIEMVDDGKGGVAPVRVADNAPIPVDAPVSGAAPDKPMTLAGMLATAFGGMGGGPASSPAAPAVDVAQAQANMAAPQNMNIAALLDELQMASSRPVQNRRPTSFLG